MKTRTLLIVAIVLFILIIIGIIALFLIPRPATQTPAQNGQVAATTTQQSPATNEQAQIADLIVVAAPFKNATVSSPLTIAGTARGNWYFEASAPVELKDANGTVIAQGHVTAQGDWMTQDFVPFTATLTFAKQAAGSTGTLVLKNDNPSGDPARQIELDIPVRF